MRPASFRVLAPLAVIFAAGAFATVYTSQAVLAQGQERSGKRTVFSGETTVVAVEVPVQVLVNGQPVRGLQAKDFRVFDGKTERPLSGFEVLDTGRTGARPGRRAEGAAGAPEGPAFSEVPPAARRHYLLMFDLAFTEPGYIPRAIDSARELLRSSFQPSDLVAVAFYSDREGVNMPLGFTPDRAQVERVLDAFDALLQNKPLPPGEVVARGKPDPLGLTAGSREAALGEVGKAAGYQTSDFAQALSGELGAGYSGFSSYRGRRSMGAFLEANILSHSSALSEQAYRAQRADQISDLADGLKGLARQLRAVEGSKYLVLFSQGFDETLFNSFTDGSPGVESGGGGLLSRKVREMVAELKRTGWVIQGVDAGGLAGGVAATDVTGLKNGLAYLAHATGGTLVENTNDLAAGFQDVLERTSVTYLLTFQAEDVPEDGSFQPVRVEVAGVPKNAQVIYRTGYFAPEPAGQAPLLERRTRVAAHLLGGTGASGLDVEARATALDYDGDLARVPVVAEVSGRDLLGGSPAVNPDGWIEAQVYVYAFGENGRVADFFAQSVQLGVSELGGESAAEGAKLAGELELAPGNYDIRVLVREPATGREGMRRLSLNVPPTAPGPRLLPPLFMQPAGERWVVASVVSGAGAAAEQTYPFVVEGKRIAPAAVPVLAPGEAARLLVPGIGLAAAGVELESRIVDEKGEAMKAGSLQILGRRQPAEGQPDVLVGRLDPDGLAPGSYRLEVLLPADAQGAREVAYAPFKVRG